MRRYTIHQFNKDFPDEDACLDNILRMLYPEGVLCRACGEVRKHHKLTNRKAYSCDICGTHVYPLAGTIFEKSSTSLKSWFYAMYLMASTRCGISAKQLERELGVTYKTAWRIFRQIRVLLAEDDGKLGGVVEVDETLIGGKPRYRNGEQPPVGADGKPRRGPRDHTRGKQLATLVGTVERGGRIRTQVISKRSGKNIIPLVRAYVLPEAMIYTNEANFYRRLDRIGRQHRRIHHKARVYVDGDVHTNTIEGFGALFKNGVKGVFHSISEKHLQSYANEYSFRYNHRSDDAQMFETIGGRVGKVRTGQYGTYSPLG